MHIPEPVGRQLRAVIAVATLVLCAILPPSALAAPATTAAPRPLVFVPGLLGSRLCRTAQDGTQTVLWGTLDAMGHFPELALNAEGSQDITACGLIREISFLGVFSQQIYGPFIDRMEQAGYRDGETLFIFDYDWRASVFDNAAKLAAFIDSKVPTGEIDIVAHSMGGLVARTYAVNEGGSDRIGRLISAGTPWRGSVLVFELLQNGWGAANLLMGGLDGFRRTVVSFPSTFDLMPRYEGCCNSADAGADNFEVDRVAAWTGLNWTGIEAAGLPDLAAARDRQQRLQDIVSQTLPEAVEDILVVGVDQRTPQHYALATGAGEADLTVSTSWAGDGTVMRASAELKARSTYPTSFATHDGILNDAAVQDFVLAALVDGGSAALAHVPVRERTSIMTELGELVQLVGIVLGTDQPAYTTGTTAKAIVRVRLDGAMPVALDRIAVSAMLPDGSRVPLTLQPDPAESDPSSPLEQSYSARFETGTTAGEITLVAVVDHSDATPRVISQVVPVIAP